MSVFSTRMFISYENREEKNFMFTLLLYMYICLHVGGSIDDEGDDENQITFRQDTKRDLSIQLFSMYIKKNDNLHDD